jgi:hypothetical protein
MSLIPIINPEVLSKVKYLINKQFADDHELRDLILGKLGPFWKFRIVAEFRDAKTNEIIPIHTGNEVSLNCETKTSPIAGDLKFARVWPWQEETFTDCIDTARYRARQLKTAIKSKSVRAGYVRVCIQGTQFPELNNSNVWSDLDCEEFTTNLFFGFSNL